MPKYKTLKAHLTAKLAGQLQRNDELQGRIQGLVDTVGEMSGIYQTLKMKFGRSRNEVGLLRQKVKELQEQLDDIIGVG